jgi:hypothetical protein
MKTKIILFIAFFIFAISGEKSFAQSTTAAGYSFLAKSSTFSYLSSGTTISSMYADDAISSSISIGFTFKYCGTDYTNIYASTNGFISFGTSPSTSAYPGSTSYLATSGGIGKAVMALWDDLSGLSSTSVATYNLSGSSPNQVFTIEFKNWLWDYSTTTPAISYQIKLFEGTNVIQIIYKQESGVPFWDYTSGATIGISGGTTTDFLSLDGTGTSPSASSTTLKTDITTKPASGQIYEFSPLPQCSGTPSSLAPLGPSKKVCSGVNFTLSENASPELGKTYQWKSRPASTGLFSNITGATSSTLITSITANTDFQLVTTCTNSGLSSTSSTKTIDVLQKPTIDSSGIASFCDNQIFFLSTATDTSYTYQWINATTGSSIAGATTNKYTPTSSARYTVKVATASCAAGATSADTINVTVKPAPVAAINPTPTITICDGEVTTLTGSGTGTYQWLKSSTNISGATSTNYSTSIAGAYTLEITNTTNGCKDTSDVTTVIGTPAPTVSISPTDSINICTGLSTTINSTSTGSGISFQWYNSAGIMSGQTSSTLTTSSASNYMLVATAGSCKDTSNIVKVKLLPLPNATITSVGTTQRICPSGSDLVLQAPGTSGYTYQWSLGGTAISGATAQNLTATSPGAYVVKVTDAYGCIKVSDSFVALLTPSAKPIVLPSDLFFCEGGNLIMYTLSDKYYTSYQWYKDGVLLTDDTLKTHISSTSGIYKIEIKDSFNCQTMSDGVVVTVYPLPVKPEIKKIGMQLTTSSYSSYQWYRNGKLLAGANKRFYDIVFDGKYKVEVSNSNGCYNISDEFQVGGELGIVQSATKEVLIFPNPTRDIVHFNGVFNVMVKDLQGKVILSEKSATEIDISKWANGLYFLILSDNENNILKIEKVAKQAE